MAVNVVGMINPIPLKGRSTGHFEKCVDTLAMGGAFPCVETLATDKEAATLSATFQARILARHSVRFQYLSKGSKACEFFI